MKVKTTYSPKKSPSSKQLRLPGFTRAKQKFLEDADKRSVREMFQTLDRYLSRRDA